MNGIKFGWLSVFFFLMPFTYALQVIFQSELFGVIPYFALIPMAVRSFAGITSNKSELRINGLMKADIFMALLLVLTILSVVHISINYLTSDLSGLLAIRLLLIYVFATVIFFCLRGDIGLGEINGVFFAIGFAALIIGFHWVYSNYMKMVVGDPGDFARASYQYIKMRNNFSDMEVNVSILRPEYRSYGLLDKHTTTGAIVAIGGLAMLSLFAPKSNFIITVTIATLFFILLSMGMATTAWIAYLITSPLVICLSRGQKFFTYAKTLLVYFAVIFFGALILSISNMGENFRQHIAALGKVQIDYILNFDVNRSVRDDDYISYLGIYYRYFCAYAAHIEKNPGVFFFGEGLPFDSVVLFPRGGDVALFELLATYGVPASLFLFATIVIAWRHSFLIIFVKSTSSDFRGVLAFACGTLLFFVILLAHYNTFFNKALFVFIPLSFGLISKFARKECGVMKSP